MASEAFGDLLRKYRQRSGLTLRNFCLKHGFDAGNYSRLERGRFPPPQKEELLEKYATALELSRGSDEWIEFFDAAATARGQIPKDLLDDAQLVAKLPLLFRTLRGKQLPPDRLDALIERIRKA
ncbi:MAG: helix-turn-helix domain-containing protein [Pirellulales bacterium]